MSRPRLSRTGLALVSLAGLSLAACGTQLQEAQQTLSQGTAFQRSLYAGYLALAQSEYDSGDYRDSDAFAQRAIRAAKGEGVAPEPVARRDLAGGAARDRLIRSRARLLAAFETGAAERTPDKAARAQTLYDCWLEEQEENRQPDDIAGCRDGFMTAVAKLEDQPVAAAPAPAPAPLPGPWVVNFAFDRSELTPRARSVLTDMVNSAKKADFMTINVNGFTDLVGGNDYNDALSEARTRAVVDFLIESGVQKNKIVGASFGASRPVVPTQEPEERNRRVEIQLAR